jgi:hypothetical protein
MVLVIDRKVDEFPDRYFTEGAEVGFTAQELEEVSPELVHTDDDGHKSDSHNKITAILVGAIKKLKRENDTINDRIETHESKYKKYYQGMLSYINNNSGREFYRANT